MDRSEEFVMLKEASEIQEYSKELEFTRGAFYCLEGQSIDRPAMVVGLVMGRPHDIKILIDDDVQIISKTDWLGYEKVWLPTQFQLQAMVDKEFALLMTDFLWFWQDCDIKVDSFDQLWLMFVMKTKFNKLWNAELKTWEISRTSSEVN